MLRGWKSALLAQRSIYSSGETVSNDVITRQHYVYQQYPSLFMMIEATSIEQQADGQPDADCEFLPLNPLKHDHLLVRRWWRQGGEWN